MGDNNFQVSKVSLSTVGDYRRVQRAGIKYHNLTYSHPDLVNFVGRVVYVNAPIGPQFSEIIEVFYESKWICTARVLLDGI
jgi:hypothetical protein